MKKAEPINFRRFGWWCALVALVSLGVAAISGFGGMAHKDACLPQPGHCSGDLLQNVLTVLYFGALITLVLCILLGVLVGAGVTIRALSRNHGNGAPSH